MTAPQEEEMTEVAQTTREIAFLDGLDRHLAARETLDPAWMAKRRAAARERFLELGFPTRRLEDWRYTDVRPILAHAWAVAGDEAPDVADGVMARYTYWESASARLVFVNGAFSEKLSSLRALPDGVRVGSLSRLLRDDPDFVRSLVERLDTEPTDAFAALNEAFARDGAVVHVPRGRRVEAPIHLLFLGTGAAPVAAHPHNLVVLDEGAELSVVERYAGTGDEGVYLTNALTRVAVGDNASLEHYKIQRESLAASHLAHVVVRQARDSRLTSTAIGVGSRLARTLVRVEQEGDGTDTTLNGLSVVDGSRHQDNQLVVHHARSHGTSAQYYKGIFDDTATGAFTGTVVVEKGTVGTDAHQTNRNLLLSEGALVDTRPQLEIHADDVKCSHGATIGQLDPQSLFYLRSRGIGERHARSILTYAFASDVIDAVRIEPIRARIQEYLASHVDWGAITEETR